MLLRVPLPAPLPVLTLFLQGGYTRKVMRFERHDLDHDHFDAWRDWLFREHFDDRLVRLAEADGMGLIAHRRARRQALSQ